MIYYHGTDKYFKNFILPNEQSYKDFGMGVYLAESEEHARKVAYWKKGINAYIYAYKVNITNIKKQFNVKEFRTISIEWVKYIVYNRTNYGGNDYDLIIGPTADAKAQQVVECFIRKYRNPTDKNYKELQEALMPVLHNGIKGYGTQLCIKSQILLDVFNQSRIKETKLR